MDIQQDEEKIESFIEKPSTRQDKKEIQLIKAQLKDWNPKTSRAYKFLIERLKKITKSLLLGLAQTLSAEFGIKKVTREAYRHKNVLIKWYDDHFDEIQPLIDNYISISDETFTIVGKQSNESKDILKKFRLQQNI